MIVALMHLLVCLAAMGNDADEVLSHGKQVRQKRMEQHVARTAKQVLVHFAPSGVKVYTPNRPAEDKDLLDRILPPDELAIVCDGLEQSTTDGKTTWRFVGNVHLVATKAIVFCHEVKLTPDAGSLQMEISGGRDGDLSSPPGRLDELTSPAGNSIVFTDRSFVRPYEFGGGISFRAGQLKQKVDTGDYVVIINRTSASQPDQ
jgi:hypothetical protein